MKIEDVKQGISSYSTPLAIIGIGCLFPKADDQSAYWTNIGKGLTPFPRNPPVSLADCRLLRP